MHFPLLEALLQKNGNLCRSQVMEFLQKEESMAPILKSLMTYACQHETVASQETDAVVIMDHLIHTLLHHSQEFSNEQKEKMIGYGIDYLCAIRIKSVDTAVLKSSMSEPKVVSVAEMEESFDISDLDAVFGQIRDLLTLMDNKNYFMEIMFRIALQRSAQSIILCASTSRAIELMGWKNNFTPFLLHHLITELHRDQYRHSFPATGPSLDIPFENGMPGVESYSDLIFLSSLYRIYDEAKILSRFIRPQVSERLISFFKKRDRIESHSLSELTAIERVAWHSALIDVMALNPSAQLRAKFPLAL